MSNSVNNYAAQCFVEAVPYNLKDEHVRVHATMSYSTHKCLPDCCIWVTKLLLIIVVSVVWKPSLTHKLASHFSSWIVQQLELEVYIYLKWQVKLYILKDSLHMIVTPSLFLTCYATLYISMKLVLLQIEDSSNIITSLGYLRSLENL